MKTVGILALQGDFDKHQKMLDSLGVNVLLVKTVTELNKCGGLIIPGGESTTLSLLLKKHDMWKPVIEFAQDHPVFGTCAGLIMLSKTITREPVDTLGLIDIETARNAYGRQVDSFIDDVRLELNGNNEKYEGVFIRAPRIISCGNGVKPLGWHNDNVVLAEQGNILVASFHPELSDDPMVHQYFLDKIN